jgi:GNAT superfamily N-acetyltransferase
VTVEIRALRSGEEAEISRFVAEIFDGRIAPLYSAQGRKEFLRFIEPTAMKARAEAGALQLVAETGPGGPRLAGMVEVRNHRHVCLLFVAPEYQRRGVGRRLLKMALAACRQRGAAEVTVNASPNAVAAYRRFGFRPLEPEKEVRRIRFVPMAKNLKE